MYRANRIQQSPVVDLDHTFDTMAVLDTYANFNSPKPYLVSSAIGNEEGYVTVRHAGGSSLNDGSSVSVGIALGAISSLKGLTLAPVAYTVDFFFHVYMETTKGVHCDCFIGLPNGAPTAGASNNNVIASPCWLPDPGTGEDSIAGVTNADDYHNSFTGMVVVKGISGDIDPDDTPVLGIRIMNNSGVATTISNLTVNGYARYSWDSINTLDFER